MKLRTPIEVPLEEKKEKKPAALDAYRSIPLTQASISTAVADPEWQRFRASLKGLSTDEKLLRLQLWLEEHEFSQTAHVQVQNYRNALARAGLL